MFVYVLDKDGQPLMPTGRFGKVRRMLNNSEAKVISRCPFVIQLLYETKTHVVQPVEVGDDTGSKHNGISAVAVYNDSAEAEARQERASTRAARKQIRRRFFIS